MKDFQMLFFVKLELSKYSLKKNVAVMKVDLRGTYVKYIWQVVNSFYNFGLYMYGYRNRTIRDRSTGILVIQLCGTSY